MDRLIWFIKEHRAIQRAYRIIGSGIVKIIGLFVKRRDNRILFTSYNGKGYNDSPRAIYEYMQTHCQEDHFEYVWAFREPDKYRIDGCTVVKSDSLRYLITALSSKCWVTNVNIERGLRFKKRGTVYLNTYHGIAIKKDGKAAGHSYADYSDVDILCADGEFHKSKLIEDYSAKADSILLCGRPREDALRQFDFRTSDAVKKQLGIPADKKVILYAPTWREEDRAFVAPPIHFEKWKNALSDEYVILYRPHHYARNATNVKFDDFVLNGAIEEDINLEYEAADLLISDYSGVFGDYSILERPIMCFAYDYEDYKHRRGFNIDPQTIFPRIYSNEDDLLAHILLGDFDDDRKAAIFFKNTYMECGGEATRLCVEALLKRIQC